MKLIFLHADKHESLLQICTMILMGMVSILKVHIIAILQYLYNFSEKKLGMEFTFLHTDKHQILYKLGLSFLIKVSRHVQSTQKRKLVIFCNI